MCAGRIKDIKFDMVEVQIKRPVLNAFTHSYPYMGKTCEAEVPIYVVTVYNLTKNIIREYYD